MRCPTNIYQARIEIILKYTRDKKLNTIVQNSKEAEI